MNAKQYLKQAYRLNELIQCNQQELDDLRVLASSVPGIDYSKDRVQTSPSGDAGFTNIVMKIIELENAITADTEKMLSLKLEIRNVISNVQDNEERLILHKRYLNFETWEQICDSLDLSLRTVQRIHANALTNVKV